MTRNFAIADGAGCRLLTAADVHDVAAARGKCASLGTVRDPGHRAGDLGQPVVGLG